MIDMTTETIRNAVLRELNHSLTAVSSDSIAEIAGEVQSGKRMFCDAAGRSRLQVEGFAMRLTQMGFPAQIVGAPTTPAITPEDVLLVCSASGETPSLVEHARKAQGMGVKVLVITANEHSSLAAVSDRQIILEASSKQQKTAASIQPMGSLFEQSLGILLDIIVLKIMEKYGITNEDMYRNHSNLE